MGRSGRKSWGGSFALLCSLGVIAAACGSSSAATSTGSSAKGASTQSSAAQSSAGQSTSAQTASSSTGIPKANKNPITMLFGSSGPAETAAEKAAGAAFSKKTGIPVNIIPAANLEQELAQDFAGNSPPNLFYLSPTDFSEYVTKGVLYSYGDKLANRNDFYSSLSSAFTSKGQLVCDPKDGSALSLYINTADWKAAGLGSAYPTNWTQLAADAKKLTTKGRFGLTVDPSESRLDAFFYQAGGSVLNTAGTKAVIDSADNVKALTFIKSMLAAKTLAYPSQLNQSDEIPAFGSNQAAMVITGNWMSGEMAADYPKISYTVHPLPAGPTGTKATLTFTNCWGVSSKNSNLGGTLEFVEYLTSPTEQLAFSKAFGTIPSLKTVQAAYSKAYPQNAPVLTGLETGTPDISLAGSAEALTAYDSALTDLATTSPQSILSAAQTNLQKVIDQNH